MNSIRIKVTLALLLMSLLGIAVLGVGSRWLVQNEFDALVEERAMSGFLTEIAGYFRMHGSWERARNGESFHEFVRRTRPSPPDGRVREARIGPRFAPPDEGLRRFIAISAEPPPIAVIDRDGVVQLELAGLSSGDTVSAATLQRAWPIEIDNQEVGLAVVMEIPPMTEVEQRYLGAMQRGWLYALLTAILVAVPAGIWLGRQITRPLLSLRLAMREIREGRLEQSVPVRSNDELGQLAADFNRMSVDLAATHKELQDLTLRDELTHLPNRRAFDELSRALVSQGQRQGQPLTVAIADVDCFKSINDTFSHGVGDKVLRQVADLLRSNLRKADVVARYGGEEFVFMFPLTALQNGAQLCEKLRSVIATHPWSELMPGLAVTISFGIAEHRPEHVFDESLPRADARLYEAKARGRNRVCY